MPLDELIGAFEAQVDITVQLLRFMNSGQLNMRQEIRSIKHALTLLGKKPLKLWLLLIAYSKSESTQHPSAAAVFTLAKTRSRLMSELMKKISNDTHAGHEAAFIGLLSLLDIILNAPLEEILDELRVTRDVYEAITECRGPYGQILELVHSIETFETDKTQQLLKKIDLSPSAFETAIERSYR